MQAMTERGESRFAQTFAQCRVDMNGCGDVLEASAHLECEREASRQLRYALTHGLSGGHGDSA